MICALSDKDPCRAGLWLLLKQSVSSKSNELKATLLSRTLPLSFNLWDYIPWFFLIHIAPSSMRASLHFILALSTFPGTKKTVHNYLSEEGRDECRNTSFKPENCRAYGFCQDFCLYPHSHSILTSSPSPPSLLSLWMARVESLVSGSWRKCWDRPFQKRSHHVISA